MSESRYSVTIRLNARGRYTWTVSTSDVEAYPLCYDYGLGYSVDVPEVEGECRSFSRAVRRATDEVAIYVKRDLEADLIDSFESNVPIAQGGTA